MGRFYSTYAFPRIVDWAMSGEPFSELRRSLLGGLEGSVLEIGSGTGLNLPHYPDSVTGIVAVDSNPGMASRARARVEAAGIPVRLETLDGEHLPMDDATFDCAVSTWTLCSIADVGNALGEVSRVLKTGGKLHFLEHGLAPEPRIQKWQHRLTPVQKVLGDGCHLDRDFEALLGATGFELRELETFYMRGVPRIGGYMYKGVGIKPG